MTQRAPAAPPALGPRATRLWKSLHRGWQQAGEDYPGWEFSPDELELLSMAVEAVDRAEKAQELLRRDGVVIEDRFGKMKEHPAVKIRNTAEASAARLLKELGLNEEAALALKREKIKQGSLWAHRRKKAAER